MVFNNKKKMSSISQECIDEITAVCSIYYDIAKKESEKTILCSFSRNIEIRFSLGKDYPEKSSPYIEVCGPTVSGEIKKSIRQKLEKIFDEKLVDCVLYESISTIKEFIDSLVFEEKKKVEDLKIEDLSISKNEEEEKVMVECPEIHFTDTLCDRKSVFQAHIAKINSKEEAMAVLQTLMSNTKIARATHRIYAYRTSVPTKNGQNLELNDCEDDGEVGAGIKLQHLLQIMKVDNVMVVVTRWYGGIHLGPDRFKHILNLARKAITDNGFSNGKRKK
jgi:hypothetical protein